MRYIGVFARIIESNVGYLAKVLWKQSDDSCTDFVSTLDN